MTYNDYVHILQEKSSKALAAYQKALKDPSLTAEQKDRADIEWRLANVECNSFVYILVMQETDLSLQMPSMPTLDGKGKIDFLLKGLFLSNHSNQIQILSIFEQSKQALNIHELNTFVEILKSRGLAFFTTGSKIGDFKGSISQRGRTFVQLDSFSEPGSSILSPWLGIP